jgi:hypothetical protein
MTLLYDSGIVGPGRRQNGHLKSALNHSPFIPAKAGIQHDASMPRDGPRWVPAFAGTSGVQDRKPSTT